MRAHFSEPYNQTDEVRAALYDGRDKLPFLYRWIGKKMIVTSVPSGVPLSPGDEIDQIQNRSSRAIHDWMKARTRADGGRDETRRHLMSVNGATYDEADALLPVFVPVQDGGFRLVVQGKTGRQTVTVKAVTRQERAANLKLDLSDNYDAQWTFRKLPNGLFVLTLPHFVTWKMKSNWKGRIESAFREPAAVPNSRMLIDLRGCEGGATDPLLVIASQVLDRAYTPRSFESRTAYAVVPNDLRPLVNTWDNSAYDLSKTAKPLENGQYVVPSEPRFKIGPFPKAYTGKVTWRLVRRTVRAAFWRLGCFRKPVG